jgi:hypothetical protein
LKEEFQKRTFYSISESELGSQKSNPHWCLDTWAGAAVKVVRGVGYQKFPQFAPNQSWEGRIAITA